MEKQNKEKKYKQVKSNNYIKTFHGICKMIGNIIGSILGVFSWIFKTLIGLFTVGIICICLIMGIVYLKVKPDLDSCREIAYDKLVNMDEDDFINAMDTYIYDKDGSTIGIINAGKFEYVDINQISMNIQNAYISQEDKRFKEHMGVDWISTARAGLALIKNRGEITQGGSTITQQVIKNTYLTQEKSFKRKIIEIMLAPQLEMKFSKAKIMEYYCNTNFYGNRCYGIQAASQFYFGKNASDVSIAEAAMLVGLSNSPGLYDPIKHYDDALDKRNKVIENLFNNGFITEAEKEEAINEEMTIVQKEGPEGFETYQSTYAVHCAALELMKADQFKFQYTFDTKEDYDNYIKRYDDTYNEMVDEIRSGGYQIYTSLDSEVQSQLQESIDTILASFDEVQENGKFALQSAAAIADNNSGYIVAIVGGRGTEDQYNRAYLSARQPGSAIKPLIDYAPAFDTGEYYPSKIMNDQEIENGPKNSGGGYRGEVTIREAVNRSINTIAWQILQQIGVNKGLAYLGNMNFLKLSYIDNDVAALSIGGFTNGTRVVDMVKGYQTLANYGVYNDRTCILDIKDANGTSKKLNPKAETKQVYDRDSAYLMTDILKGTITEPYGTGRGLALNNMPAAGKTGTTNNNKDTWFCGYTKYYTASVWVGYDIPREMPGIYGATYAGKIWQQIMNKIHTGLEVSDWERPETVYESFYDQSTGDATTAETGFTDLFSRSAEIKAEKLEKERQDESFFANIESQVTQYENKTIAGPEDTYSIEEDFSEMNNVISQIEDTVKRNELYDRIYNKYKELKSIRVDMEDEIALYEKEKVQRESAEAIEAAKKAEEDRLAFIRNTKEENVNVAIKKIESLKYIPDSNTLILEAQEALESIKEYDSYNTYYSRLEKAIENIKNLPNYEDYKKQEAIKESESAARKESELAEKESMENQLNITIIEESKEWQNKTSPDQVSGPGYSNSNNTLIGPGM